MATTTTSTTNFSDLVVDAIRATAEEEMRARLHFTDPANLYLPGYFAKGTDTIVFPRYADLSSLTTTLTEGTPPTDQELSIDSEYVTATEKGGTVAVTNLAQRRSPHNLFRIAAQKAGLQAALSLHTLVRDACQAGTNVIYANGSARSSVDTSLTGAIAKQAPRYLNKHNVPRFPDGFYHGIATSEQLYALMTDANTGGWIDAVKYANSRALLNGEVGSYAGVRWVDAGSEGKVFEDAGDASADVHSAFIFGPGAYGVCGLSELEATYVGPGGDHTDPLGQKAIAGWHLEEWGTLLIDLAGARYVRIESAETTI